MQTLCSDSISLPYSMLFFFPGRQALPCRGNWVSQEKFVFDSHYHQLMLLCAEDDPRLDGETAVHVSKDPKENDRGKPNLVNETNCYRAMKLTLIVSISR